MRALTAAALRGAIVVAVLSLSFVFALKARAADGIASYYHEPQRVACGGGRFNPNAMTAAHRTLPCGTKVRVTHARNGRSVVVTINDRGPAAWTRRILDLSRAAAAQIGMLKAGLAPVRIELLTSTAGAR